MKKLITTVTLAVLFALSSTAFAMDITTDDLKANVSGTVTANTEVRLVVGESDRIFWIDSMTADSTGNYSFECALTADKTDKTYNFIINGTETKSIIVAGDNTVIAEINSASESTVNALIEKYAKRFGIDMTKYNSLSEKAMFAKIFKTNTVTDAAGVVSAFNSAVAVEEVNEAERSNIFTILENEASALGIDYSADVASLSKTKKEAFAVKLLSSDYESSSGFGDGYGDALKKAKNTSEPTSGSGGSGSSSSSGSHASSPVINSAPAAASSSTDGSGVFGVNTSDISIFADISDVPWAKDAIEKLYASGVVKGKSNILFAPNDYVTREEFVTMIVRMTGMTGADKTAAFNDIPNDDWCYEAVNAAFANGIISGISADEFGRGMDISRQDAAVISARVFSKYGKTADASVAEVFTDDNDISDYAKNSVYTMRKAGVINGVSDNAFEPAGNCTRAMAAVIISKLGECIK